MGRLRRGGAFVLKKMPIARATGLYDCPHRFGSCAAPGWLADNTIVFATSNPLTGLQRVSADGGMPTPLTRPDTARGEFDHLWPLHAALVGARFSTRSSPGLEEPLPRVWSVYDLEAKTSRPYVVRGQ